MKWLGLLALLLCAPSASPSPAVYTRLIFGSCQAVSFAAASGRDEDVAKRKTPFHCDQAIITFLDRYQKRVRIKFTDTTHSNQVSTLEYLGTMRPGHRVVDVSTFYFEGPPALAVTDISQCTLDFHGKEFTGVVCGANYRGGANYQAIVAFDADPGQTLGDNNDQP